MVLLDLWIFYFVFWGIKNSVVVHKLSYYVRADLKPGPALHKGSFGEKA